MSRPDLPFEPFSVERVAPQKPTPPTPVNWFETIAPRMPEPNKAPSYLDPLTDNAPGAARHALFGDVDAIALAERKTRIGIVVEPPEIKELRLNAMAEAERILADAQERVAKMEKEAVEEGFRKGYEQGCADGERETRLLLNQRADAERAAYREDIADFLAHIEEERRLAWERIEPQAVGLVLDLAKKVIKQEIEASRDIALSVIRNALRRVADEGALRIRVHTDDLERVRANREDLIALLDGIRHVEIVEDRRIGKGGCIVETDAGNIDARIETQLADVQDTMERMVARKKAA